MSNNFVDTTAENGDLNQYWYSPATIAKIAEDVCMQGGRVGFLSTPSIYFSLPDDVRKNCFVFDYDKIWANDRGYVFYDFNQSPDAIDMALHKTFDMVVVDPPFITRDVWEKYANTVYALLKKHPLDIKDGEEVSKVLCTTVFENAAMMKEFFGSKSQNFMPSIPNLVYQYNLYTNYESSVFSQKNPEIPE